MISSFLLALLAPIMTITLATFAGNKVEGLALFKGLNLVVFLPAAAFFIGLVGR